MSNTNCTKESIREISSKEGYYSYPYRNNALSLYSIGCCFPTDQQEDQFQQIQESQYKSLNIEQYHPHNFYCKKNEKLSISRKYHMPIYRENIERLFNVANLQLPQYKVEKIHYYRCNFEIDPRTPFPSPVSVQSVEEQLHEQDEMKISMPSKENYDMIEEANDTPYINEEIVHPISPIKLDLEANAEEDADRLFIAFSGMGCDIKTICGILTHRNRVQREEIRIAYESKRAEILSKRVISEVLEPLRTLILYLLYTGPDLDAIILNMSRTNNEIDCNTFRYILCSQSISKLHSIIESYTKLFNMSLQDQIRNVFTGNFAEILLFLLNKSKEDFNLIDEELELEKLKNLSLSLIKAPYQYANIICNKSSSQLRLLLDKYKNSTGQSLNKHLKRFYDDDFAKTLRDICKYSKCPIRFHSKALYEGFYKKDIYQILRVICTRNEADLSSIHMDYNLNYKLSVEYQLNHEFKAIYPETVEALLTLIGL